MACFASSSLSQGNIFKRVEGKAENISTNVQRLSFSRYKITANSSVSHFLLFTKQRSVDIASCYLSKFQVASSYSPVASALVFFSS